MAAKDGDLTSEWKLAKNGGTWGVVAFILGAIVTVGGSVTDQLGGDASVIVGGVVSIAGIVQKTLVDLGYIKSRTDVKRAESDKEAMQAESRAREREASRA